MKLCIDRNSQKKAAKSRSLTKKSYLSINESNLAEFLSFNEKINIKAVVVLVEAQ